MTFEVVSVVCKFRNGQYGWKLIFTEISKCEFLCKRSVNSWQSHVLKWQGSHVEIIWNCSDVCCELTGLSTRPDIQAETCSTRPKSWGRVWRAAGDSVLANDISETNPGYKGVMRANGWSNLNTGAEVNRKYSLESDHLRRQARALSEGSGSRDDCCQRKERVQSWIRISRQSRSATDVGFVGVIRVNSQHPIGRSVHSPVDLLLSI